MQDTNYSQAVKPAHVINIVGWLREQPFIQLENTASVH